MDLNFKRTAKPLLGFMLTKQQQIFKCTNVLSYYTHWILTKKAPRLSTQLSQLPVSTPAQKEYDLPQTDEDKAFLTSKDYRGCAGCLLYVSKTRNDIMESVREVCCRLADPTIAHWKLLQRILGFLRHTIHYYKSFPKGYPHLQLEAYADGDFANRQSDRKSVGGQIILLGGTAILAKSKTLRSITGNTVETELVVQNELSKNVIWVRRMLNELGLTQIGPTTQWCDNDTTVEICHNNCKRNKSKAIDIQHLSVRHRQASGIINVKWCPTRLQKANFLTKPVGLNEFRDGQRGLGITRNNPAPSSTEDSKGRAAGP